MTQLTRYKSKLDKLTQFTPQLAQEIKTRVKLKNTLAILASSIAYQFVLVILALGKLPEINSHKYPNLERQSQFSRYCTGALTHLKPPQQQLLCLQDLHDHWLINWQLFWFDIFAIISGISILLLIVVGTYLIVANLSKEKAQGTLTLATLVPQPAAQFVMGKIMGIPILLYGFLALNLPLHFIAGLQAGIPLSLMIAFYLAIVASCAFFYSLGYFFSYRPVPFKNSGSNTNQAAIITVAIACFLLLTTCLNHNSNHDNFGNVGDWLLLCNPLNLIVYLGQITAIPVHYFNYAHFNLISTIFTQPPADQLHSLNPMGLENISIYGQSLQKSVGLGLGLVTANFLIGAYWFWQAIKRRFYNSEQSSISKEQSYWLSLQVVIFSLGLTLNTNDTDTLLTNFGWLRCFLMMFVLVLILSLSAGKYQLHDWLHNRQADFYPQDNIWQSHSNSAKYSLWQDLMWGESSPANLAIAINLLIIACYLTPALIIFTNHTQAVSLVSQLSLQLSLIFLFATLWQWLNLQSQPTQFKNIAWLPLSIFIPLAIATSFTLFPITTATGFIPLAVGILTQWLAIILVTGKTRKQLLATTQQLNSK